MFVINEIARIKEEIIKMATAMDPAIRIVWVPISAVAAKS